MPTSAELLADAKSAYHALLTGQSVVSVRDSNGESVTYTTANASRLKTYITELEALIAGSTSEDRRPLRPIW